MASAVLESAETKTDPEKKLAIIDTDVHNVVNGPGTITKYLAKSWHDHHLTVGARTRLGQTYPRAVPFAARDDSYPAPGVRPGSDLPFMQEQLLDEYDLDYGILNCLYPAAGQSNLEYGAAVARAINDWQVAEWIEPEPRLKASLVVAYEDADLAVEEIERFGDHPGFVQLMFLTRTMEPLGRRKYWKIYEAALKYDLKIAIHFGGLSIGPITGAGKPSHYIEDHAGMSQGFQAQVASYVYEGVFERFPELQVVLIEGGFAWLPSLMWRMDSAYKKLKVEVPQLKRLPSEIVRDHFWVSTQPMEEPPKDAFFAQMLAHMDMDDKIMFATDYPHWDFDSPYMAIPPCVGKDLKRDIMSENARALYGLA